MEQRRDHLTNEEIRKKFKSQFELVNYAIRLAENMIKTGRDARVKTDAQNRSIQVLEEILLGKDQFDEIVEPVMEINIAVEMPSEGRENFKKSSSEEKRKPYRELKPANRKRSFGDDDERRGSSRSRSGKGSKLLVE